MSTAEASVFDQAIIVPDYACGPVYYEPLMNAPAARNLSARTLELTWTHDQPGMQAQAMEAAGASEGRRLLIVDGLGLMAVAPLVADSKGVLVVSPSPVCAEGLDEYGEVALRPSLNRLPTGVGRRALDAAVMPTLQRIAGNHDNNTIFMGEEQPELEQRWARRVVDSVPHLATIRIHGTDQPMAKGAGPGVISQYATNRLWWEQ